MGMFVCLPKLNSPLLPSAAARTQLVSGLWQAQKLPTTGRARTFTPHTVDENLGLVLVATVATLGTFCTAGANDEFMETNITRFPTW